MNKLYRSRRDKKVTGLCGGLAEMMNVDATLLRLLVVITAFFTGGTVLFIYVIAAMVIPKEPGFDPPAGGWGQGGWGGHGGHGGQGGWGGQGWGGNGGHGASWQNGHNHHNNHNNGQHYNANGYNTGYAAGPQADEKKTNIDEVMKEIERKAMQRELEELKAKVAAYENTNKTTKGDV
ncbi:PspC domain-containing protein [Paenibacillus chartarius]|uniref:PspC domain-containing protein n=1 Tax=Paenibacillus chartarius TaxID=747481 RepID=A0ABV6DLD0_9BACL